MDLPIVLSHTTAYAVQHAPGYLARRAHHVEPDLDNLVSDERIADEDEPLISSDELGVSPASLAAASRARAPMPRHIAAYVRIVLTKLGVPLNDGDRIDVLVPRREDRVRSRWFTCHAFGNTIGHARLVHLAPEVFVVDEATCFVQAASWMTSLELVEYGFELCGDYAVPDRGTYVERRAPVTHAELATCCAVHPGVTGSKQTRRALHVIRDGSRSPMETALAMMVGCDRSVGGLGFRAFDLNVRVDMPPERKTMTSSPYFEIDLLARGRKDGAEYDGSDHTQPERRAHDAERLAALTSMGYRIVTLTQAQFASQLKLHRALNAIARQFGLASDESPAFQRRQNELRRFVIRRWPSVQP